MTDTAQSPFVKRRRNANVPFCARCGGHNDRVPQSYCKACHKILQAEHRRKMVSIPVTMVTPEQQQWLNRRRNGRPSVSREMTTLNKEGGA